MHRLLLWGMLGLVAGACLPKKVINAAEAELMRDPSSADAWASLGDTYRRAGRKDEAAQCYTRAVELDPEHAAAQAGLTRLGGGTLSELERQALADPNNDELWGDLGDLYAARGQREIALKHYLYAMRLDPGDSEWREAVIRTGGLEAAIAMHEQGALGGDDEALGDFGDLLVESGDVERACELYTRANGLDPSDGEWIEKLATVCGRGDLAGEAPPVDFFGSMLGIGQIGGVSGDDSDLGGGRAALAAGDHAEATRRFEAALASDPTDKEALSGLIVASGRTATDILSALAESSTYDELWGDLGDAWLAVGELAKARAAYERAQAYDPGDGEWRRQVELLRALDR